MRRAILMMLLTVASSSSAAAWVKVYSDESATYYANPATIRKAGNMVKMWRLVDFKTAKTAIRDGVAHKSGIWRDEYDCKEERMRTLSFALHSRNMGGGKVVYSNHIAEKGEPGTIPPGSVNEYLWKFACRKR